MIFVYFVYFVVSPQGINVIEIDLGTPYTYDG